MDGQSFDTLVRRLGAARSRRQALVALGGSALVALGLREPATAQIDALGCRSRLQHCESVDQCCGEESPRDIDCNRVSRKCEKNIRGKRCCGDKRAKCADDCDCCRGLRCKGRLCR